MARVTIAGYYGYGNAGDEAMLEAMLTGLRGLRPDVPITVLSGAPEATAGLHRVQAVNARSPGAVAKALLKSELVISGGGSLLQDDTSAQNLIYHLGILAFARWGGAKTMVYAQGIGPLR
ncbi:MAG: polysaccharide pyruvyl transferase family protein, partial [Bacillota bacterium]